MWAPEWGAASAKAGHNTSAYKGRMGKKEQPENIWKRSNGVLEPHGQNVRPKSSLPCQEQPIGSAPYIDFHKRSRSPAGTLIFQIRGA